MLNIFVRLGLLGSKGTGPTNLNVLLMDPPILRLHKEPNPKFQGIRPFVLPIDNFFFFFGVGSWSISLGPFDNGFQVHVYSATNIIPLKPIV